MRRLPATIAELGGLRARRYVRVSSSEQGWKYGPDGQHDTIDRTLARIGLVEAGAAFVDEQSAWSRSDERPALRELITAAIAGEYDILVVAYFSRWSRDTELALRLRRELHAVGVAIWFAEEAFSSSDDGAHERYLDEAVAAEKYSHRLSRVVKATLAAKFERYGDQAGTAGLGFMRTPQPEARLAIDVATMPQAVALFERYAAGDLSYRELAKLFDMSEAAVRTVITNPLYNGWAVRHRRSAETVHAAAPWRSAPPVSDELWARVAEVRDRRSKNEGSPRAKRTYMLAKLLWCQCGKSIASDSAQQRNGRVWRRYRHEDCPLGGKVTWKAEHYEDAIAAQVTGMRLSRRVLEQVRASASQPAPPPSTDLRRAQLERELRSKAAAHARRELTTEAYLAEHARLTATIDGLAPIVATPSREDPDEIVRRLRRLRATWDKASEEARATLVAAIYERITVAAGEFVSVKLTEAANELRLALVLPETVELARPAGLGSGQTTARIRIEGRDDWLKASRTA
jgi:DNA invertase Pin-like site-specific DNA recombinase